MQSATDPLDRAQISSPGIIRSVLVRLRLLLRVEVLGLTLILVLAAPMLLLNLGTSPAPWFDEGLNTHAARLLAESGFYGTRTVDGANLFDPAVTTGPTMILPIAGLFYIGGVNMALARLVSVGYSVAALTALYFLSVRLRGQRKAWLVLLLFLAMPAVGGIGFFAMGRQVLGESASFAFTAAGLLALYQSWRHEGRAESVFAGVFFGLAVLSKLQSALTIFPALLLIALLRSWRAGDRARTRELLVILTALAIPAVWIAVQRLGASPEFVGSNAANQWEGVRLLLFPGFTERTPNAPTSMVLLVHSAALAALLLRAHQNGRRIGGLSISWEEAQLGALVLVGMVWFGLFSIGWSRYAYLGLMFSGLVLGGATLDLVEAVQSRLQTRGFRIRQQFMVPALVLGAVASIAATAAPLVGQTTPDHAAEMGRYIEANVPESSVIESWEWEVDALSGHWAVHHPPQYMLLIATRQRFLLDGTFRLHYDALQADPDYLLAGPFSNWTHLYEGETLTSEFVEVAVNGPYRLYRRR